MGHLQTRLYQRPLNRPLQTHHGLWSTRTGLLLRWDSAQGQAAFGEIAPIPWFGTETLEQAQDFCAQFVHDISVAKMRNIPDTLPACQFGLGSIANTCLGNLSPTLVDGQKHALLEQPLVQSADIAAGAICALLPAGKTAVEAWPALWAKGHRTFKWKIGVAAVEEEWAIFWQLVAALPDTAQLRLDANGGLMPAVAEAWLAVCDQVLEKVEFVEQPLPPDSILDWLATVRDRFQTPIAVDESVATLRQLQQVYQQLGNQVIYVVKPAIAGFPDQLYDFCTRHHLDVVFSSALETPIGRDRGLSLAQRLWATGLPQRALGFGVGYWFADDWDNLSATAIWEQL